MRGYNSWVIADYKKDKVDGNLGSLVAFYRPQIEMHKGFWGKMSGEKGKKSRIDEVSCSGIGDEPHIKSKGAL